MHAYIYVCMYVCTLYTYKYIYVNELFQSTATLRIRNWMHFAVLVCSDGWQIQEGIKPIYLISSNKRHGIYFIRHQSWYQTL